MKLSKIKVNFLISIALLLLVIILTYKSRTTEIPDLVADYDPWWFYRHAKEILDNNLKPPKWDILSFFPPGRPFPSSSGWLYTIILFYKLLNVFTEITFMKAAILSPAIMASLSVIPAYFLGKELSNEWGGLATAIFAVMTPVFVSVSLAGYLDTDVVVVFYSYLCVYSIFLAMKNPKWYSIAFAVISNLLFVYSWWFGWYVILFFSLLLPLYVLQNIIKNYKKNKLKINVKEMWTELKKPLLPLLMIVLITNIIGTIIGLGNVGIFILTASGFRLGKGVIVNVSVAELQPVDVLTKSGFNSVIQRIGTIPSYFMLIGLPLLVAYKLYKKERPNIEEIFLFIWALVTFYIILNGVRFALLFSVAVAASAGYVIGSIISYVKNKELLVKSTVLGLLAFLVLLYTSQTLAYSMNSGGYDISSNWIGMLDWLKNNADKNALVATWWDPGHIIAGYTGLKVHGDGAHCGPTECIPYNHNNRIQDMGKIMSTNDEKEAIEILKKYSQLKPEDCQKIKDVYGNIVPKEACDKISEIYFVSSSDLIGKFTWMNYFGGFRVPVTSREDFLKNPGSCCASTPKTEEGQVSCGEFAYQERGVWVWCPWVLNLQRDQDGKPVIMTDKDGNNVITYEYGGSGLKFSIIQKNNTLIPIYNNRFVITNIMFFNDKGQVQFLDLSEYPTKLEKIDGLIWIQPGFENAIYFAPQIKDSIFVRTFFFSGSGLSNFEMVYSNSEIKLFKVNIN